MRNPLMTFLRLQRVATVRDPIVLREGTRSSPERSPNHSGSVSPRTRSWAFRLQGLTPSGEQGARLRLPSSLAVGSVHPRAQAPMSRRRLDFGGLISPGGQLAVGRSPPRADPLLALTPLRLSLSPPEKRSPASSSLVLSGAKARTGEPTPAPVPAAPQSLTLRRAGFTQRSRTTSTVPAPLELSTSSLPDRGVAPPKERSSTARLLPAGTRRSRRSGAVRRSDRPAEAGDRTAAPVRSLLAKAPHQHRPPKRHA